MKYSYLIPQLKKECLVLDIETWSAFSNGKEININSQFETYVNCAKIKWFGAYSYLRNGYYILEVEKNKSLIRELLDQHSIIIGFNSEEFDFPILRNNGLVNPNKKYTQIDCLQILGKSTFINRGGYPYKNRGELMEYKFKDNSLKTMAQEMKLDVQKGEIDYHIFEKNSWTPQEQEEIKTYLKSDIAATKQMFEKLCDFWMPFTDLLREDFVRDFSWIKNSIAALTYKAACTYLGVDPTYSETSTAKEEMGGNVLLPVYEEARGVWYVDFASLYPHLFCMFNLFAESKRPEAEGSWHGNDLFQVRGYYNISQPHKLNSQIINKLRERITLKQHDPKNPMIYAIKIFLNGLYGVARSAIFEQIHTPNCGWDCCWLGQQVQKYVIKRMADYGFETIYGDTDSAMLLTKDEQKNKREYVQECLKTIIAEINAKVPFPVETFAVNIDKYLDYILFPFSDQAIENDEGEHVKVGNKLVKESKGKKKNYLYIYTDKDGKKNVELIGLPIKKDNATVLGMKIFTEVLEPKIIENINAKFPLLFIQNTINEYLKKDEIIQLIAQEYRVKPLLSYKKSSQIQAQISAEYFEGRDGVIKLIKNTKVGKVGLGTKYCTIEEARANNLTADDFDLKKLWNELEPFIIKETK